MSINTLFGLMWQNNWENVMYMFRIIFPTANPTILVFFISFMQMANLIFVNIIIAFVIDTY